MIQLYTSQYLLDELEEVLKRNKFDTRKRAFGHSSDSLVKNYSKLATLVKPTMILPVVKADLDDDNVIACAVYGECQYIVSGDAHLLSLISY